MSCIEPISFNHIFTVNVNDNIIPLDINVLLLSQYLHKALNKFTSITGDLPVNIKEQINHIILESSYASKQIVLISAIGLLILLVILTCLIFGAICRPYMIEAFFVLALFFIITISIIIYTWSYAIYNRCANNINLCIKKINKHLALINTAVGHASLTAVLPTLCNLTKTDIESLSL